MNTNTTLPVVAVRRDIEDREAFLAIDWTDGRGDHASVTIGLDLGTHEGGQAGLRDNVEAMLQHTYLMGVDAHLSDLEGRNTWQADRIESDQARIEQLEAALASALRVCDDKDVELGQLRDRTRPAAEREQQLETDLANAKVVVEQVQNEMEQRVRTMQTRYDRVIVEFDGIAEALMQEAIDRNWCSDYETFTNRVNSRTSILKLLVREKTYIISFSVDAEPPRTQREITNISDVYNVEVEQIMQYSVSAQVTCSPDDIEAEVDRIRDELSECEGVTDVTHNETEEDDS